MQLYSGAVEFQADQFADQSNYGVHSDRTSNDKDLIKCSCHASSWPIRNVPSSWPRNEHTNSDYRRSRSPVDYIDSSSECKAASTSTGSSSSAASSSISTGSSTSCTIANNARTNESTSNSCPAESRSNPDPTVSSHPDADDQFGARWSTESRSATTGSSASDQQCTRHGRSAAINSHSTQ